MTCEACPFAFSDRSEQAQNYGCLPSPAEILRMKKSSNQNWGCHEDSSRVCAGFAAHVKKYNPELNVRQGGIIRYETWYKQGEEQAMQEAAASHQGNKENQLAECGH